MPHSFGAYLILYIMVDLFNYTRRASSVAHIGALGLGGDNPIRIQSMTTTNTNDTEACVQQAEEIIKAGGELVRFTTQGSREAENMKNINAGIRADGYRTPLVADVHFNPNVADVAALYCEKVRVNPGNYVDPARKFIKQEYTDEEYAHELQKIEVRFVPFLNICKEHHTAIRIGVNHGSLSDRIRNRYGDTPEGIVESCLEFLRICKKENFHDVVISIKSSNTVVMVRSMRLLVEEMEKEGMNFLGWREVTTNPKVLGSKALEKMPSIMQAFIQKPEDVEKGLAFDRMLYIARREFEQSNDNTYVVSMNSRTIVYKGMFLVGQLRTFFHDLQDVDYESAIAMVHSRFSTNTEPFHRTQRRDQHHPRKRRQDAGP